MRDWRWTIDRSMTRRKVQDQTEGTETEGEMGSPKEEQKMAGLIEKRQEKQTIIRKNRGIIGGNAHVHKGSPCFYHQH